MCYVFNCFGWALDFLQRAITFFLACILSCVLVIGMLIAIAAGIAYGYNYSMAEFLTFTRQDVTVYMRRGQFYDKPDLDMDRDGRRSGDQEDLFGMNRTTDYEDTNVRPLSNSLQDNWGQVKDTRKYAEVLTKYSSKKDDMLDEQQIFKPAENYTPPPYTESGLVEVSPNPTIIPTTILQSGTSQIVMRKFQTISEVSYLETTTKYRGDNYFYQEPEEITIKSEEELVATRTPSPFMKAMYDNHIGTQYIPMRHWDTTKKREVHDDIYAEEVDEDNLVYKMKPV